MQKSSNSAPKGQAAAIPAHSVPAVVALLLGPHLDALAVMVFFPHQALSNLAKSPELRLGKSLGKQGKGNRHLHLGNCGGHVWPPNAPDAFPASYLIHWAQLCS